MNIDLKKPLVYVTRDIERALGMEPVGNYFVVSNKTPFGESVQKKHPDNVWLIDTTIAIDTYDLLLVPEVQDMITKYSADIVVFQNTPRIERLALEKGWNLINPKAELAKQVEEKISQVQWLQDDANLLPPHKITVLKDVQFEGKKFVLQFNHSHTGEGTYIIDDAKKLAELQTQFPDRECRVVDFISGPVFTVNAIVGDEIFVGNPSYQITGIAPFTDLPFSTIGNDWELPQAPHYKNAYEDINKMAARLGERLQDDGWRGLFGIDVVYDEKKKKTYLLELNARQPASSVYESTLQKKADPKKLTVFEAHLASLLKIPMHAVEIATIEKGSQIVKRVTHETFDVDVSSMRKKGLLVLEYINSLHNKELYRIQSNSGIMEGHNLLNSLGLFIASCVKNR